MFIRKIRNRALARISNIRKFAAVVALGALCGIVTQPVHAQIVTLFPVNVSDAPFLITEDGSGNIWFSDINNFAKLTPSGSVTEIKGVLPSIYATPGAMTLGPGGFAWFSDPSRNTVGFIMPNGTVDEFGTALPGNTDPLDIAEGADGNVWFSEGCTGRLGRIDPQTGTFSEFLHNPGGCAGTDHIVAGPDGNIWFTENGALARSTLTGVITEFRLSNGQYEFGQLGAGPDGNVWFTYNAGLGNITPSGQITLFGASASTSFTPLALAAGADGNIWFTENATDRVGRITPAGVITEFPTGLGAGSYAITAGPGGNLWITSTSVFNALPPYAIARITPPAANATNSLSVTVAGTGEVTYSPITTTCSTVPPNYYTAVPSPATCILSYLKTDTVTLTADPGTSPNFFSGWSGDCSGTGACVVNMNTPHQVTATYGVTPSYTLTINLPENVVLTVSSATQAPTIYACNTYIPYPCTVTFLQGTVETLSVSTPSGQVFTGWSGACTGTGSCVVTMNSNQQVTGTYGPVGGYHTLTTAVIPSTEGNISLSPSNGTYVSQNSAQYAYGTVVTVTANAAPGYLLGSWTGGCAGSGACVVTMNQDQSVQANMISLVPQTGFWWDPAEPGHGYVLEYRNGNAFMALFLYDSSGRATWWGASPGFANGQIFSAILFADTGGPQLTGPYTPTTGTVPSAGSIDLMPETPATATLEIFANAEPLLSPYFKQIQRYAFGPGGAVAQPAGTPETGWWWAPTEPGRGYALKIQGGMMFFAGYMYDASGNPTWYMSGPAPMTNSTTYQGTWQQLANGQLLTGPWNAPQVVNADVGAITILFSSTTAGTLTFPDGRTVAIQRYLF